MATYTGNVRTFGFSPAVLPGLELLFIPPAFGVDGGHFLVTQPVPATIATDGSGAFTVELEPLEDVRPGNLVHGPWGYGVLFKWLNGAGVPIGYDAPDLLVYARAGGGPIDSMIDAPILPTQVWVTEPGVMPTSAKSSDFIFNFTANHLGRIA